MNKKLRKVLSLLCVMSMLLASLPFNVVSETATDYSAPGQIPDIVTEVTGEDEFWEDVISEHIDDYTVTVTIPKEAEFPIGTTVQITPLQNNAEYRSEAAGIFEQNDNQLGTFIRVFDITFYYDGMEIEPLVPVGVTITFDEAVQMEGENELKLIHVHEEEEAKEIAVEAQTTEVTVNEGEDGEESQTVTTVESLSFESDKFSTYIVAEEVVVYSFTESGNNYEVVVKYNAAANMPEDAELSVEEITEDSELYEQYAAQVAAVINPEGTVRMPVLLDISLKTASGEKVQLGNKVQVIVRLTGNESLTKDLKIVHFPGEDPFEGESAVREAVENADPASNEPVEAIDIESERLYARVNTEENSVSFSTNSFSVFAFAYTVDFFYNLNGETIEYHIPGGSVYSLRTLLPILGIVEDDPATANDEVVQFINRIASVSFTDESLVKVVRVDEDTTAGAVIDALGVEIEYAGNLTEDDVTAMRAEQLFAPDWALVSLKPFFTEEELTITLKNGEVVKVKVTDQSPANPDTYIGKQVIIYDNSEKRAMIAEREQNQWRTQLFSVNEDGADSNEKARWTVEYYNGAYFLKAYNGKYLKFDYNNIDLTDNRSDATPLTIQQGGDPNYRIYERYNWNNCLCYCTNNEHDGFFSAFSGANNGDRHEWLYIREAYIPGPPYNYTVKVNDGNYGHFTIRSRDKSTWIYTDYYNEFTGQTDGVTNDGYGTFYNHVTTTENGGTFRYWLKDDGTYPAVNNRSRDLAGTNSSSVFNKLDRDTTFIAFFAPEKSFIIRVNDPEAGGSISYSSTPRTVNTSTGNNIKYYYSSDSATLTAVPETGYVFVGWFNGGSRLTTDVTYTIGTQTYDMNLTARFERGDRNYFYVWYDGSNGANGGINPHYSVYTDNYSGGATSVYEAAYKTGDSATITLPSTAAAPIYSETTRYVLNGWYNIYGNSDKPYYAPGETATIYGDTVFYADWFPSSYNFGEATSTSTISTNSFINTYMFDYNNLFNMESIVLDSSSAVTDIVNYENWNLDTSRRDFVFMNRTSGYGKSSNPNNRDDKNSNQETGTTPSVWSTAPISALFSTSAPGTVLGQRYVGKADHLYKYNTTTGYYYYDSALNAASYNKADGRFYVYDYTNHTNADGSNDDFLPYNYGNKTFNQLGEVNYWFGMKSDVKFFLPNAAGYKDADGQYGNQSINGNDMVYRFSGDDDVWVCVDGSLRLNLGGVHGKVYGEINFSTGVVTVINQPTLSHDSNGTLQATGAATTTNFQLDEGDHTLTLYYLERGSSQSNCAIYFNLAPRYSLQFHKVDNDNESKGLSGAKFGVYMDPDCTVPADLWGTYVNTDVITNEFTSGNDGYIHCTGLYAGRTYYIKELTPPPTPEGMEGIYPNISNEVITLTISANGTPSVSTTAGLNGMVSVESSGNDGQFMFRLKIKNRINTKTEITVQKTWSLVDGSEFKTLNNNALIQDTSSTVSVTLNRYYYTDNASGENMNSHIVQLITRYYASGDKPSNRDDGSLVTYQIDTREVEDNGSISFDLSTDNPVGIRSVTATGGTLSSNLNTPTEEKPFYVNGGRDNLPTRGTVTVSNVQNDAVIYVTFIGSAESEADLAGKIHISNVTTSSSSGTPRRIVRDTSFSIPNRTVTLNSGNSWSYKWTDLDSSVDGKQYYYYVTENSVTTSLGSNQSLGYTVYGVPSIVKTYSSDGLSSGTITVHNTFQALKVKLRKRDANKYNGNYVHIPGGDFHIYTEAEYQKGQAGTPITPDASIIKADEMGAYNNSPDLQGDSLGRFYFGYLPIGTYYIVEENAPAGYAKLTEAIKVVVSGAGVFCDLKDGRGLQALKADSSGFYNIYIDNTMQNGSIQIQKRWSGDLAAGDSASAVLIALGRISDGTVDADWTAAYEDYGLTADQIYTDTNGTKYIKLARNNDGSWPTLTVSNLPQVRIAELTDENGKKYYNPIECFYYITEYGYLDTDGTTLRHVSNTSECDWIITYSGKHSDDTAVEDVVGKKAIRAKADNPDLLIVTNSYASATPEASKNLNGLPFTGTGSNGDELTFTFTLREVTSVNTENHTYTVGEILQNVETDEQGVIAFEPIPYTERGTHVYEIAETGTDSDTMDYDEHRVFVKVEVTDDNGLAASEPAYYSDVECNDRLTEGAVFNNTEIFSTYVTVVKKWKENPDAQGSATPWTLWNGATVSSVGIQVYRVSETDPDHPALLSFTDEDSGAAVALALTATGKKITVEPTASGSLTYQVKSIDNTMAAWSLRIEGLDDIDAAATDAGDGERKHYLYQIVETGITDSEDNTVYGYTTEYKHGGSVLDYAEGDGISAGGVEIINTQVSLNLSKIVEAGSEAPVSGNLTLTNGLYKFTVTDGEGTVVRHVWIKATSTAADDSYETAYKYMISDTAIAAWDDESASDVPAGGVPVNGLTPGTYTVEETESSITPVENAVMYLKAIAVTEGEGNSVDLAAKTATVAAGDGNVEATFTNILVSTLPELEKQVLDQNDSETETAAWSKSADYDIGDEVPYRITTRLPSDYYRTQATYSYQISDVMNHLQFVENSGKVYALVDDGNGSDANGWYDVTALFTISAGTYTGGQQTVTVTPTGNNLKSVTSGIKLDWSSASTYGSDDRAPEAATGTAAAIDANNIRVVQFRYRAELKADAGIGFEAGNTNSAKLTYTNGPESTGETAPDTNTVYTYQLIVNKTDGTNALEGAEFQLFKKYLTAPTDGEGQTFGDISLHGLNDSVTELDVSGLNGCSGDYYLVSESGDSGSGSRFIWTGLDDGLYLLVETGTVEGYKPLAGPIALHIETSLQGEDPTGSVTVSPSTYALNFSSDGETAFGTIEGTIANEPVVEITANKQWNQVPADEQPTAIQLTVYRTADDATYNAADAADRFTENEIKYVKATGDGITNNPAVVLPTVSGDEVTWPSVTWRNLPKIDGVTYRVKETGVYFGEVTEGQVPADQWVTNTAGSGTGLKLSDIYGTSYLSGTDTTDGTVVMDETGNAGSITITNEPKTTEVQVEKTWSPNFTDSKYSWEATFVLKSDKSNGEAIEGFRVKSDSLNAELHNSITISNTSIQNEKIITGLPIYELNSAGAPERITYTVEETGYTVMYDGEVVLSVVNGQVVSADSGSQYTPHYNTTLNADGSQTVTVSNSKATDELVVRKKWMDVLQENLDTMPAVQFHLMWRYADENDYANPANSHIYTFGEEDTFELNSANNWEKRFSSDLLPTTMNGRAIVWFVKEVLLSDTNPSLNGKAYVNFVDVNLTDYQKQHFNVNVDGYESSDGHFSGTWQEPYNAYLDGTTGTLTIRNRCPGEYLQIDIKKKLFAYGEDGALWTVTSFADYMKGLVLKIQLYRRIVEDKPVTINTGDFSVTGDPLNIIEPFTAYGHYFLVGYDPDGTPVGINTNDFELRQKTSEGPWHWTIGNTTQNRGLPRYGIYTKEDGTQIAVRYQYLVVEEDAYKDHEMHELDEYTWFAINPALWDASGEGVACQIVEFKRVIAQDQDRLVNYQTSDLKITKAWNVNPDGRKVFVKLYRTTNQSYDANNETIQDVTNTRLNFSYDGWLEAHGKGFTCVVEDPNNHVTTIDGETYLVLNGNETLTIHNVERGNENAGYRYWIQEMGYEDSTGRHMNGEKPIATAYEVTSGRVNALMNIPQNLQGKISDAIVLGKLGQNHFTIRNTVTYVTQKPEISKKLNGVAFTGTDSAGEARTFEFELKQVEPAAAEGKTPYTQTVSTAADGTITFNNIEFTDAGTYVYEISEKIPENPDLIYDTKKIYARIVISADDQGALSASEPAYFTDEACQNSVTEAVFDNTEFGELDLTKLVAAAEGSALPDGIANVEFNFRINLTFPDTVQSAQVTSVSVTIGEDTENYSVQSDEDGAYITLKLKKDETAQITKLPVGTAYSIDETDAPGYVLTWTDEKGNTGTISATTVQEAELTNTPAEIDLIVIKKDNGDPAQTLPGAVFTLTKVDETGTAVEGVDPIVSDPTGDDGTITFENLKPGYYTITETTAPAGYVKTNESIRIEVLVDNNTVVARKVGNEEDVLIMIQYEQEDHTAVFINTPGTALPSTGGSGTLAYTLAGLALMLLAGMLLVSRKRKTQRNSRG